MHIGMIVDEERLLHERPMLDRLAIGLVDADATVTRIVPEHYVETDAEHEHPVDHVTSRLEVRTRVPRWMRRARARRLAAALDRAVPDVLYAIGTRAWEIGRDLREEIEVPLVLDFWCQAQTRTVSNRSDDVSAYVVPTDPLGGMLGERIDPELVSVVPPGVPVPDKPRPILASAETAIALAIVGSGRDVASYRAMLAALSGIVRDMPQVQAAIELRGPGAHAIWREAERLGLLPHLSAITDAAPLRPLLTRCDVLIMPERYGEMRSLTLDAMARGMVVVAARDRALDMLVDNTSALTVEEPSPETWGREIRRVLSDTEFARELAAAARLRLRERHDPAATVRQLLTTLGRAVGGDSYSFAEMTR